MQQRHVADLEVHLVRAARDGCCPRVFDDLEQLFIDRQGPLIFPEVGEPLCEFRGAVSVSNVDVELQVGGQASSGEVG